MFGGVSDFSCKYTHGTSTVGGGGKATVRTTVRTELNFFIGTIYLLKFREFPPNLKRLYH